MKVASFNVHGPVFTADMVAPTVAAIEASGADIVGIQEGGGHVPSIVAALGAGWTYREFATANTSYASYTDAAILSRLAITQTLDGGVRVELAGGGEAFVFSTHARAYPYQPYDIRDGKVTTQAAAIDAANAARGTQIDVLTARLAPYLAASRAVFSTGDFNEPSHLDWTQAAADAGLHPFKVAYPASRKLADAGMRDSYRVVHPDPVADPGDTWTPTPGPNEVFDRIDFVYGGGSGVTPVASRIVGEDAAHADIVSPSFPSDHRLVVSTFTLSDSATTPLRSGVNLISNGGAEGNPASSASANIVLTDWETAGDDTPATAQLYGEDGYAPAPTTSSGSASFYGGITGSQASDSYSITQVVSLAGLASDIDAGEASYTLGGAFGGYADQEDSASLIATFLDASDAALGAVTIGGVTAADRNNLTRLIARDAGGHIPALTRSVNFTLTFTKAPTGTYNDAAADNLSFVVSVAPEPSTAAVLAVTLIPGLTRRRRRRPSDPVAIVPRSSRRGRHFVSTTTSSDVEPRRNLSAL